MRILRRLILLTPLLLAAPTARAETPDPGLILGTKLSAGGRFDNVRRCVASSAGTRGGPAADVSFLVEIPLRKRLALAVNIPVFRPVLFGLAFKMLQFEPDVTLVFRRPVGSTTDLVFGPSLGLSLHWGPD
jgi:hypothetical protein